MKLNVIVGLFVALVIGLAGCGGGGGGGDNTGVTSPINTTTTTTTSTTTTTLPVNTNSAPVANSGTAQSVVTGAVVTLDGRGSSDAEGNTLTYLWTISSKPEGSLSALSSNSVVKPTFIPDVAGVYVLNLVVNDGTVNSPISSVTVTASPAPSALRVFTPIAGSLSGFIDGIGSNAKFDFPIGITTDGVNLYVADELNNAIRKIEISTSAVTTLAGLKIIGSADGVGSAARFSHPNGITADGTNLYIADTNNNTVRKIVISTGAVTTIAGSASFNGTSDGIGSAARFSQPYGITTDGVNLYVADTGNHTIRKIVISTGSVTTLAGSPGLPASTDGIGSAARFTGPWGITMDGVNLYVTDGYTIRKIVISTGAVTTLAGSPGLPASTDGIGSAARFTNPSGITTDGTNLFIADSDKGVRKVVISSQVVTTISNAFYCVGMTMIGSSVYITDLSSVYKLQ